MRVGLDGPASHGKPGSVAILGFGVNVCIYVEA